MKPWVIVVPCANQAAAGIKFVSVPQPKSVCGFSPNLNETTDFVFGVYIPIITVTVRADETQSMG